MTKEDFNKQAEAITIEEFKNYEKEKRLWENKKEINSNFLMSDYIESEEFENILDPKDMINEMNLFIEKVKSLPYHVNGEYDLELDAANDYGEAEIYNNQFRYDYYQFISKLSFESKIKYKIKDIITKALKPSSERYSKLIDCKLLTLYKNGDISFEILQKLTYTNCNL